MDIIQIESSFDNSSINKIIIPDDDKNFFINNIIKEINKLSEHNDMYIPYNINTNAFKKKFLVELKFLLNLNLVTLKNIYNSCSEKKYNVSDENALIGRSNIYDLLNYNFPNQQSKHDFWHKIFKAVKKFKQDYNGWYYAHWNGKQLGLLKFIKKNHRILGGDVIRRGKEVKWKSNEFFDDEKFYKCFKYVLFRESESKFSAKEKTNRDHIACSDVEQTLKIQEGHQIPQTDSENSGSYDDKKQILYPDESNYADNSYFEERRIHISVDKYERDGNARNKCLNIYRYKCAICGFDFKKVYGEIGENFIHVHHKIPLEKANEIYGNEQYKVDPKNDLIPICPNCHAMIHKLGLIGDAAVEELKRIVIERS